MDPLAHASIGLMAKSIAPKAPLWSLLAATQVLDVLSIGLIAVGIERGADTHVDFEHGLRYLSQPSIAWSHGLLMAVVWSVVVALIAYIVLRDRRTSVIIGLMVISHWLLDFSVYFYMPILLDGSSTTGLGLITSRTGFIMGIVLEVVLIAGGNAIYLATRRAPLRRPG